MSPLRLHKPDWTGDSVDGGQRRCVAFGTAPIFVGLEIVDVRIIERAVRWLTPDPFEQSKA